MKYLGGLLLLLYAAVAGLGYEPFTQQEKGPLPAKARGGRGALFLWHGGYHGGK